MTSAVPPGCRHCGAAPRVGARFCDVCGSLLATAPTATEYKQVTALFADVVGSMGIAAALDVERLREILTDLLERSAMVARRYGAGSVEHTGNGVMALFGAPVALEDHAFRACLAALSIQQEANRLASEVVGRDGIELRMRVGLNSGRVIAGEIGSGSLGYAATGQTVGFAQRMQTVAPPGGVLLSETTATLVERLTVLAEPEQLCIKGSAEPVPARRLLRIGQRRVAGGEPPRLVGRRVELAALEKGLHRAYAGCGGAVCLVGSPGVGKSRLLREVAALATRRGAEVHWTFCESHQRGVPYRVAARLLQSVIGVAGRDGGQDRTRVREFLPDADPQDLVLLDDLLGIANAEVPSPTVDPDARRRRLTALCRAALFAPNRPALYLVEDVHWIDESSQAMLTDLLVAVEQTRTMVLISSRPERDGALPWLPRARTLALSPLHDSDIGALLAELLGTDSSVGGAAALITARAAGNPFFAEEMVRELVQCGTLQGRSGNYVCHKDIDGIAVPPTVQAVIAARIDRLDDRAKRTLNAAAVIGERVDAQLLADVGVEPEFDELIRAELVDPVRLAEGAGYVFRHPLIRAVAYESQLRSSRAELHRRLAAAIEACGPESADQNAALIAEHLRAAGEPRTAYAWYMRAGAWAANRDIAAAGISWGRAHAIADELPADDPDRAAMCIAPLSMLCGTAWRVQTDIAGRFEELRRLCTLSGDKAALAVGMAGIVTANLFDGHVSEAARRAAEQMALLESIGEPELTIGAGFMAVLVKYHVGYIDDVLRWAQAVIDWADGDPARGGLIVGSPLALALVWRGLCRCWLGVAGWRQDLDDAVALARGTDPATGAWVVIWKNQVATGYGVLLADDAVVRELEEVLLVAEQAGDDTAYGLVRYTLGVVLVSRGADDAERGMELIEQVRDMCVNRRFYRSELPVLDFTAALDIARRGDLDSAIPMLRAAVNQVFDEGRGLTYGVAGSAGLVETLLARGTDGDVREAQQALDRMANIPAAEGFALHKITLYRLRALLAATNGDDVASRDFVMQYRGMAAELGFEGHLAMAEAMTGG